MALGAILGAVGGAVFVYVVHRLFAEPHGKPTAETILGMDLTAVGILFTSYVFEEIFKISRAVQGATFEVAPRDVFIILGPLAASVLIYVVGKRL